MSTSGTGCRTQRGARPPPRHPSRSPSPAGAYELRRAEPPSNSLLQGRFRVGEWEATWDSAGYAAAIGGVREAIARGDVYQVNLVQHLSAPFDGDPAGIARALRPLRPLHARPFQGEGFTIVSASPELFLSRRGPRVWTCPIKGTRPLGDGGELTASDKDAPST